jgi:hypothetical protein
VSDSGWRDATRRASAKAGIADARAVLAVEIVRVGAVYRPQCCGRTFGSWLEAGNHITSAECAGSTEGEQP